MTNNLELWDKVSRVPKEHLKAFDRGNFKGTAIKPAWAIKTLTEALGPVGDAWSIGAPDFTLVDGVKGEKLVYCVVSVTMPNGGRVVGVGGDKVTKYIAPNEKYNRPERWENDDEAFKKAYTDALTNALVKLGVGADIHMGLWDGNKYVDEGKAEPEKPTATPSPTAPVGANGKPAQLLKRDEARALYSEMKNEISQLGSDAAIEAWKKSREADIKSLGDWSSYVDDYIQQHVDYLLNRKPKEAAE